MIKPDGFDPSRNYPVLVYVYGEPGSQTVLDAWGTVRADYHRLIADLGYLVVSIDNRGTPAPKEPRGGGQCSAASVRSPPRSRRRA